MVRDASTAQALRDSVEEELRKLRQQHLDQNNKLEESLENNKARQRAMLQARLGDRRAKHEAEIAQKAVNDAEKKAMLDSLHDEEKKLWEELEKALAEEAAEALRAEKERQEAAEAAARQAAAVVVKEQESQLRALRDKYVQSEEKLKNTMDTQRERQEANLKDRINKRRQQKEEENRKLALDAQELEQARKELAEQEARDWALLERRLDEEREKKLSQHRRELEEAERLQREEAQVRAEAEARAKERAKADAENQLKRMMEAHMEESEALQTSLDDNRVKQESKLRERLAKKKQEKEQEIVKSAANQVGPYEQQHSMFAVISLMLVIVSDLAARTSCCRSRIEEANGRRGRACSPGA